LAGLWPISAPSCRPDRLAAMACARA